MFAHAFNRSLATKGARLAAEEERAAGVGEIAITEARAEPQCGWFKDGVATTSVGDA